MFHRDLIFLVADSNMEQTVRGLMSRPRSLGIREGITFDIIRHPRHDPGVFRGAHEYLRNLQNNYRYALVMFDRVGCDKEAGKSASELEAEVEERLQQAGWRDRCAAIALDPELEIWVFARSSHVIEVIANNDEELYGKILVDAEKDLGGKPIDPKNVMEQLLRKAKIPRSSSLYGELARKVGLESCQDRAFGKFKRVLQEWFSAGDRQQAE